MSPEDEEVVRRARAEVERYEAQAQAPRLEPVPLEERGDCWEEAHASPAPKPAAAGRRAEKATAKQSAYKPLLPYCPFPLGAMPPLLGEYSAAAAAAIGCDVALVALPALAVAAGCIGNSRAIQLKKKWSEPAVLWGVTIMRSGSGKSPGFAAALDPLMEQEMERRDDWEHLKEEATRVGVKPPAQPACRVTTDATVQAV